MAKLHAYYGLCPLIDQKTLLGVSQDAEQGHVIVTLGKNIAIKYRLSDQKQIESWRTKDKFTSPVIFDKEEEKYVSSFNQVSLRLWSNEDVEHLDKIKKYRFTKPIYTIISCNNKTFIIFKNGCTLTLKDALEQRKNMVLKDIIDINVEEIIDVTYSYNDNSLHIGLITQSKSIKKYVWMNIMDNYTQTEHHEITLIRDNCNLAGYTCCQMLDKKLYFLSLWSDGQLYCYPLSADKPEINQIEEFGSLYAKIESISCNQLVAMTALASDHIAIYGADCNQEGASLIIYNTQFKISQSKQTFKMFTNTTKIWCIENVLLLCSGQNLAVVPFRISTEQLSELIGSHKFDLSDSDVQQPVTVKNWDIDSDEDYSSKIPPKIRTHVVNYLSQGLSETAVCNYLIPIYIENLDINAIEECIDYFTDISESCLIKILAYLMQCQLSFDNLQVPVQNHLIDKLLSIPCTNSLLLPHIKEYFTIDIALRFLSYICFLLSSDVCLPNLNYIKTENKLIEWGCILLDGNYQKFLLSRDESIIKELNKFDQLVEERLMYLCELQTTEPVINEFIKGKTINSHQNNNAYFVEDINLY